MIEVSENTGRNDAAKEKQSMLNVFLMVLQQTATGKDIADLVYDAEKEIVQVKFKGREHVQKINVACDSKFMMLKDVINGIDTR